MATYVKQNRCNFRKVHYTIFFGVTYSPEDDHVIRRNMSCIIPTKVKVTLF